METGTQYPSTRIAGAETDAHVMGLERDQLEDNVIDQIRTMASHEAFQGDIRIMCDCHVGSGAVIGFTMPLQADQLRICPNTIGVDIGCGMLATKAIDRGGTLAGGEYDAIDSTIRSVVPLGRSVHERNDYHMGEDFPWVQCHNKWERIKAQFDLEDPEWFDGYGLESYFKPLCSRIEYDPMRAINSVGTLGGGNHFIELDVDENGDYWFVLHSGSRGIGLSIAEYWQDEATRLRTNAWIREQLPDELNQYIVPDLETADLDQWFRGGKGQSYIDSEAIRADVSNNELIGLLHDLIREAHPQHRDVDEDLDYLEGQEAGGYLVDMVFAQTYAWENRAVMMGNIFDVLGLDVDNAVHTPHNLVDFDDGVVRKGAVSAHDDEQFVLPFNMADGTLICEGKGNDEWNNSCAHGAGRVMSRTQAFDEIELASFKDDMADVHSSSVTEDTIDEAPAVYKPADLIYDAIKPTADVVHELTPVLNIKATE